MREFLIAVMLLATITPAGAFTLDCKTVREYAKTMTFKQAKALAIANGFTVTWAHIKFARACLRNPDTQDNQEIVRNQGGAREQSY